MSRTARFARLLRLRSNLRRQEELKLAAAVRERIAAEQETRRREEAVRVAEERIPESGVQSVGQWLALRAIVEEALEHLRLAGIQERRQRRIEAIRLQEVRKALVAERQLEELMRLSMRDDAREELRQEQKELDDLRPRREVVAW